MRVLLSRTAGNRFSRWDRGSTSIPTEQLDWIACPSNDRLAAADVVYHVNAGYASPKS